MPDNLPQCPEHSRIRIRLEEIKSFYDETNSIIREDIEYLIGQAEWALRLDQAGEALNQSSAKYIKTLEDEVYRLRQLINSKED